MGALYVGPAVHYWFGFLDALAKKPTVAKRCVAVLVTHNLCICIDRGLAQPRPRTGPNKHQPNTHSLPKFKLAPVLFQLSLDQTFGASVLNSGFLVSLWVVQALVAGTLFPLGCVCGVIDRQGRAPFARVGMYVPMR